jgi:siroheme synthase
VVVYDRLVDPALLDLAPVAAVRIPVGKAKGGGTDQATINALLVEHAARGEHVVRLKGGDPFLFGRGSEEVVAVTATGIPCDVIPGVTSALGAPALAGIAVAEHDHDWDALARSGSTLVVLMAATTASSIAGRLLEAGRPDHEPVAMIHRAGMTDQVTSTTDLATLATEGCPFPSPTVLVIGEVASRAPAVPRSVMLHA